MKSYILAITSGIIAFSILILSGIRHTTLAKGQQCHSRSVAAKLQKTSCAQLTTNYFRPDTLKVNCCLPAPQLVSPRLIAQAGWPKFQSKMPTEQDELQIIVDRWMRATASMKIADIHFDRIVYDKVFQVEKRGNGRIRFEAPDKLRYDLESIRLPNGNRNQKNNPNFAKRFQLKSSDPQSLIFMREKCWNLNHQTGIMEEKSNDFSTSLAEQFIFKPSRQRFHFKLVKQNNDEIWIAMKPKLAEDAVIWREMKVILDAQSFLPRAIQVIHSRGHSETVHIFSDWKIDVPWQLDANPFVLNPQEKKFSHLKRIGDESLPDTKSKPYGSNVVTADVSRAEPNRLSAIKEAGKIHQASAQKIAPLSNDEITLRAVLAIKRIGWLNQTTVPHLIRLLDSVDAQIRATAAKSLGEIGISAKAAIPALGAALNDTDQQVSQAAFIALKQVTQAERD